MRALCEQRQRESAHVCEGEERESLKWSVFGRILSEDITLLKSEVVEKVSASNAIQMASFCAHRLERAIQ